MTELKNLSRVLISPGFPAASAHASPLQLGVMASGSGTNFAAVAKAISNGHLNAEIKVLIYNNPSAKVKERAEEYGIPRGVSSDSFAYNAVLMLLNICKPFLKLGHKNL